MLRIPTTPPVIVPLDKSVPRTLWSVMIPVYNCASYIEEAVKSVLKQDMGEAKMQIEVVDDCSTDVDVAALVKLIGKGRVLYYRQDENVGSLRNFETCINRSRGQYVHLLHGDDRVREGFYKNITTLFQQFPDAGAAYCAYNYINEHGKLLFTSQLKVNKPTILENAFDRLVEGQLLQYVAIAVKREVYETLGGFYGVVYGEDWEMWARIAKHFPMAYTPKVMADYRIHEHSISSEGFLSGSNIKDIEKVFHTLSSYLPDEKQKQALKRLKKNYTHWVIPEIYRVLDFSGDKNIPVTLIKELLRLHTDVQSIKMLIKLIAKVHLKRSKNGKHFIEASYKMYKSSTLLLRQFKAALS